MKRSKQSSTLLNVDRLSALPDAILCHILSFLPTKVSAATGILARRWRYLWADVPTIHLHFHSYWKRGLPRNSEIIERILSGYNLKALRTFRFKHKNYFWLKKTYLDAEDKLTQSQLEEWIASVIAGGKVRNIELEFRDLNEFRASIEMPKCLFAYKSLVDLRLHNCEIRISSPASVCFPSLEKLHLSSVEFNNDETIRHFISGCPRLEELVIESIVPRDSVCWRISSPTLKWLMINFGFRDNDCAVEIITPALRYLQMKNCLSKRISARALMSLTEADIKLKTLEDDDDAVYSHSVVEFLDRMSNVKCLKFDIDYKFLHSAFSVLSSRFDNLTKLELAADWRFILKFLETADNLQVLVVNWVVKDLDCWVEPEQVAPCLLSRLTSIVISSFCCEECEYTIVRYLLKNAKVLTSMKIECVIPLYEEKSAARTRISQFVRGSEDCELEFY